MNKNEIKKELYKQKPIAKFEKIRFGVAKYYATILVGKNASQVAKNITFAVPVDDMGEASFEASMDAKLLVRWIVDEEIAEALS